MKYARLIKSSQVMAALLLHQVASSAGPIISWGYDYYGLVSNVPAGQFTSVTASPTHAYGLRLDGSIAAWGRNNYAQVSNTPFGSFVAVAAGEYHGAAIHADGTLVSWGLSSAADVPHTPTGTFTAIAAGGYHTVAIRPDGTLASWGEDSHGQVSGTPSGTFIAVAGMQYGTVGLKSDGTLVGWGWAVPTVPTGTYLSIAADGYKCVAIQTDGTVAMWGESIFPATGTFSSVDAGRLLRIGIRSDGHLVTWGSNGYGEVSSTPGGTYSSVAAGYCCGLAVQETPGPAITGQVNLLDWNGPTSGQLITVAIRNEANAVVQGPTTVTTSDGGAWSLNTTLPAGRYKVSAKASHWLRKQVTNVEIDTIVGSTSTVVCDLKNGDAISDNVVDLSDYTTVGIAFNSVPGSPSWRLNADLNGDQVVDLTDYTILILNFNSIGDL